MYEPTWTSASITVLRSLITKPPAVDFPRLIALFAEVMPSWSAPQSLPYTVAALFAELPAPFLLRWSSCVYIGSTPKYSGIR